MEAYMCDTHTMQKEHMTTNMYVCKNVEGMKAARTCNVCNKCQWQWKALWNALITAEKLRTLHGKTWRDLGCNVNNKEQCDGIRWPGGETKWTCENGRQVATNKEVVAKKRDKTDHLQSRPLRQGVSSWCNSSNHWISIGYLALLCISGQNMQQNIVNEQKH